MLISSAALGQLQPKSPVGPTWDCLLGGVRNGVAYLTFANDGTLSGYEVLVPTPPASPKPALVSVIAGSNGLGTRPGAPVEINRTELFGACPVQGTWGFDSKGRVIGSFLEVAYTTACATTAVPVSTNLFDSLEPTASTNVFPITFSLTVPLSTNKAAGTFKNQTISYFDQVPVSTNVFEAPAPISETNVLSSGFSTTSCIGASPASTLYSNRVTCYLPPVPLNTNTFGSSLPYAATNHLPSGTVCITLPIHTNLELITFTEELTRYQDHVPVNSSTFTSPVALAQTNYLPDGTYCETLPLHTNTFADTYSERIVCYLNPFPLNTNSFKSESPIMEVQYLPDGTCCVTQPILTNLMAGSFLEQMTFIAPNVPFSSSTFNSLSEVIGTNSLPDGTFCITVPLSNSIVGGVPIWTELVTCFAANAAVIATNFESSLRIAQTNTLPDGMVVITIPLFTNMVPSNYLEQVTCYAAPVALATNTFNSASAYTETDINPDGAFCVTAPIATNLTLISFTEQITCYTNHVPSGHVSTFVSPIALSATNCLPDGSYCETVVRSTNAFAGSFTEQMTCYLEPVVVNSYGWQDSAPCNKTVVYPDGTYCVTQSVATNTCAVTYKMQSVTYVTQTDCLGELTNTVNFTGTVVPGKRLTLLGKSTLGGATYRGVPAVFLPDISGSWRGLKHQNRMPAYEFFDLSDSPYAPNSYVVSGNGPGYTYSGLALLSSQKRVALACDILVGTNYQSTRAVCGAFNARKASSSACGLEAASGMLVSTNRVSFQFSKRYNAMGATP